MLKDCKVLVTGGAGFIGSHIATQLAEANEVIIFDIFTTGKHENIGHLDNMDNVKVLKIDVRDKKAVTENMVGVDYVFHLAAVASVPQSIADPIGTNEHNVTGTLNILEAARENHVKKVMFSSSAAVYGDEPTLPKRENMLTQPKSPYAVTKITAEDYIRTYKEAFGLPAVALRYFNVFGPRQHPRSDYASVVPKFMECVMNGSDLTIFGDGTQTRDFIYVQDVMEANIKAAESEAANGEVINIATGEQITVTKLAELILELSGKDLKIDYQPPRHGDILHSYADITKAKKVLNWQPAFDLKEGLKQTYDFFKN